MHKLFKRGRSIMDEKLQQQRKKATKFGQWSLVVVKGERGSFDCAATFNRPTHIPTDKRPRQTNRGTHLAA